MRRKRKLVFLGMPRKVSFCPHHTLIDPIQSMRSAEVTARTIEVASVIN